MKSSIKALGLAGLLMGSGTATTSAFADYCGTVTPTTCACVFTWNAALNKTCERAPLSPLPVAPTRATGIYGNTFTPGGVLSYYTSVYLELGEGAVVIPIAGDNSQLPSACRASDFTPNSGLGQKTCKAAGLKVPTTVRAIVGDV